VFDQGSACPDVESAFLAVEEVLLELRPLRRRQFVQEVPFRGLELYGFLVVHYWASPKRFK
jgi:hypothetical protein